MKEYHKIQTVFLRDPATNHKTLLLGEYALPEFAFLENARWVFTEKVDGTNIRVMWTSGEGVGTGLRFGGKTDAATTPPFLLDKLAQRFAPQIDRLREIFPDGGCLYGEGYGARIQKGGGNYRGDVDFVLFDVKVGDWWLQRDAVEDVAAKLSLDVVPIIGMGTLFEMVGMARDGFASRWNDKFQAEGIVARPATELRTRNGQRIITKIKYRDFTRE